MKKWYILVYGNGNKTIMEQAEYEKEMREEYGTAEGYYDYDEAVVGIIEFERKPFWSDDLVYDKETETYYLKEF